jgi:alcohol dehydrogenase (NADP+)
MKTLQLNDGNTVPQLGLGTWQSKAGEVEKAVLHALKVGYRHIDCAWIYGNESEVGSALKLAFDQGVVKRDEVFITSKLWNNAHGEPGFSKAIDQTLGALGLEYVDLYLIHWPVAFVNKVTMAKTPEQYLSAEQCPLSDTWALMEAAQKAGKARSIGVSNCAAHHIEEILAKGSIKPVMNQVECHPYFAQASLLESCNSHGIHLTAYSPLGSSDAGGKRAAKGIPSIMGDETVADIASHHNATQAQILIAWAIQRGSVVIPKSVTPSRIEENRAAEDITLNADDMQAIDALERDLRYIDGTFFCGDNSPYSLEQLWGE